MSGTLNPGQGDNPLAPTNDPGYNDWWNAINAYNTDYNNYLGDLAELKADLLELAHMKGNAGEKLMFCINVLLPAMQKPKEDNIKVLADTQNIDTALREMMNEAQTIWVQSKTWPTPLTPTQVALAGQLYQDVTDLQYAVDHSVNSTTGKSIIGAAELAQLQSSITDIQTQFGSDWGDFAKMAADMQNWWASSTNGLPPTPPNPQNIKNFLLYIQNLWDDAYKSGSGVPWSDYQAIKAAVKALLAANPPTQAQLMALANATNNLIADVPPGQLSAAVMTDIDDIQNLFGGNSSNGGGYGNGSDMESDYNVWQNGTPGTPPVTPPQLTALNTDFQTIMETVSTLGAALNAKLSYFTNDYNQLMGIYKNVYKDVNTQETTIVHNERSN
jgi:hypothetical protein